MPNPQMPSVLARRIAAQALMLHERLDSAVVPVAGFPNHALIEARLDAWQRAVSPDGEQAALEAYWAWQGIDRASAERAVSPVDLPLDAPLPAWTALLAEALEVTDLTDLGMPEDEPLPFGELWLPFIAAVRRRLTRSASYWERLSESAHHDIERGLLKRLALAAAQTVYTEFDAYRAQRLGALAAFVKPQAADLYRPFVDHLRGAQLIPLLEKYPVLARLIANRSQLWGDLHVECLERLEADWSDLLEQFAGGVDPGRVTALQAGISDYHRGGRGTILLTFESGLRLVYKPKPMGIELAYNQFLDWLNTYGAPVDMKALTILNRGEYGWAEFASHQPLTDQAAAERYYCRIGALACVLYMLLGTDCHNDNLVAHGEYPVAIDNETLFSHAIFLLEGGEQDARSTAYAMMRHSVLVSLLLPQWMISGVDPIAFDPSGIGALEAQLLPSTETRWLHVNTDRVKPVQEQRKLEPQANVPRIGDAVAYPEHYHEHILAGFSAMYRFFMAQRSVFTGVDSPLSIFKGQTVRHIVRHSNAYTTLLNSAFQPKLLKDGVEYSLPFEMLIRAYFDALGDPTAKQILRAERNALMRGDLPLFSSYADGTALLLDTGELVTNTYFDQSSYDRVIKRIEGLDERDLNWQKRFINGSIQSRVAVDVHQATVTNNDRLGSPLDAALTVDELVAEAAAIGRLLEVEAIHGDDGSATWIASAFHEPIQRHQLEPINLSLYNGQAGTALFLAAAAGLKVWDGARSLCLAALQPIRDMLRFPALDMRQMGIGAGFGVGAWLYLLARAGEWLDDSDLIEEARRGALRLTPDIIAADRRFDVLNGSAGAVLGLLTVYELTSDPEVLARAVLCGKHLVNNRTPASSGLRAWDTHDDGSLWGGFSHGAAGISYPLARLYGVTGAAEFRTAAEEALAYENTLFDAQEGNWRRVFAPAFVEREKDRIQWFWSSWCHGAPGIGLARAASLRWFDNVQLHSDVDRALTATQRALTSKPTPSRFLCCGDMGRVECLFTMARLTGISELEETARRYAARIVQQAAQIGGYRPAGTQVLHNSGLFTGISGIGYELLRLGHPERVPSALLWE